MDKIDNEIFELLFLSDNQPSLGDVFHQLSLKTDYLTEKKKNEIIKNRFQEWKEIERLKRNIVRPKKKKFPELWRFDSVKDFYFWHKKCYEEQHGKCFYCKSSEEDVAKLSNKRSARAQTRGNKFEVERKDSSRGRNFYNSTNCILICYICNNAKSDLFTQEEFQPIAEKIAQSIHKALSL